VEDAFPGGRKVIREFFRDRLVSSASIPDLLYWKLLSSSILTLFALGEDFAKAIECLSIRHLLPKY